MILVLIPGKTTSLGADKLGDHITKHVKRTSDCYKRHSDTIETTLRPPEHHPTPRKMPRKPLPHPLSRPPKSTNNTNHFKANHDRKPLQISKTTLNYLNHSQKSKQINETSSIIPPHKTQNQPQCLPKNDPSWWVSKAVPNIFLLNWSFPKGVA